MRRDFKTAIFIGFLAALFWIPVLRSLSSRFKDELWALIVVVPVASAAGLYVCRILLRRIKFFYQFAKYAIIGFLSAGIDLAIFNVFFYLTGVERGPEIILFKTVSFSFAMLNSYNWNKVWTFGFVGRSASSADMPMRHSGGAWHSQKFFRFAAVTTLGLAVNVGLTSLIINLVPSPLGFTQLAWNNLAAVTAIIVNVIWNFAGYKIIVFKSPHSNTAVPS